MRLGMLFLGFLFLWESIFQQPANAGPEPLALLWETEVAPVRRERIRQFGALLAPVKEGYVVCWERGERELTPNLLECALAWPEGRSRSGWIIVEEGRRHLGAKLRTHAGALELVLATARAIDIGGLASPRRSPAYGFRHYALRFDPVTRAPLGAPVLVYDNPDMVITSIIAGPDGGNIAAAYATRRSAGEPRLRILRRGPKDSRFSELASIVCPDCSYSLSEPSLAVLGARLIMSIRAQGAGQVYFSESRDGGRTWSEPAPNGIEAPASITRLDRCEDGRVALVFNGVRSKTMGPRNRLDVILFAPDGRRQRHVLYPETAQYFYSNFDIDCGADMLAVAYQKLHLKVKGQPDSVFLAAFALPPLHK